MSNRTVQAWRRCGRRAAQVAATATTFISFAVLQPAAAFASTAPNPGPVAPPGLDNFGNEFIGWMKWVAMIAGVLGLMACGIMMSVGRRGRSQMSADGASGIPWIIAGLSTSTLAAGIVGALLT